MRNHWNEVHEAVKYLISIAQGPQFEVVLGARVQTISTFSLGFFKRKLKKGYFQSYARPLGAGPKYIVSTE